MCKVHGNRHYFNVVFVSNIILELGKLFADFVRLKPGYRLFAWILTNSIPRSPVVPVIKAVSFDIIIPPQNLIFRLMLILVYAEEENK